MGRGPGWLAASFFCKPNAPLHFCTLRSALAAAGKGGLRLSLVGSFPR